MNEKKNHPQQRNQKAMKEEWRPVVGFEGLYEVSDQGRVKSLSKLTGRGYLRPEMILKLSKMPKGYLAAQLRKDSKNYKIRVHTLVLTSFVGPRPADQECRHLDGDPTNNRLDNLVWGTRAENMDDRNYHNQGKFTSSFRGVWYVPRLKKWTSQISTKRVRTHLGYFDTEEEAAKAYGAAREVIEQGTPLLNTPGLSQDHPHQIGIPHDGSDEP